MGSNSMIKYLSEEGDKSPFLVCISCGNPFNLLNLVNSHENSSLWKRWAFQLYHRVRSIHPLCLCICCIH